MKERPLFLDGEEQISAAPHWPIATTAAVVGAESVNSWRQ